MGRPPSKIDWKKVDSLLVAGCSGAEIAAYLGVQPQTIYDRCLAEKKILFSRYSQEKQAKGDSILRAHQYAKALGKTTEGDNTLLIWLGKNRLRQKEINDEDIQKKIKLETEAKKQILDHQAKIAKDSVAGIDVNTIQAFDTFMKFMAQSQASSCNIADNSIKEDNKS
jgi:hypothetical protein